MVPLNIKTDNYLLHSMIKIPDLIKIAKENNITSLTITDNNMFGVLDFYMECEKNNIKPIIGLEINLDFVLILYAQNYEGYLNLIKLSTLQSEENLNINYLKKYKDNLIAILPYKYIEKYDELKEIYKYLFVGYKTKEEKEKITQEKVYLNEILCINKEDNKYLNYLKAIKEGTTYQEEEYNNSLLPLIEDKNNTKIEKLCHIKLKFNQDLMPKIDNSYPKLKDKCIKGLKKIFGQKAPRKYVERLKKELEIIKQMGFCDYFLIVSDYVNYAKENNILVGPGRGSAAGSLVAYLCNITTIDPVKYNLLFERFLNPERITMPDIDIDFEDIKRDQISKYCISKYGLKKVAPIITFGTLGPRQVIRDIGRASNIDSKKIDILSKMIDPKISLKQNYLNPKIVNFLNINSELKQIWNISLKFEGIKRHTSIHAAGIIISNTDLDNIIPLDKSHIDFYSTGYDMKYLEKLGLLKMDLLGLKNLTLINNILKDINKFTFNQIPENDKKALEIFEKVNTVGIFQFESEGMKNFLSKLKVKTFEDIVLALALYRPGPMKNIDSFIKRREGKEKIDYIDKSLENILKPTYGIIIYQEQIMQIAGIMAGYTMAQADNLRRAMSKKKEDVLLKEKDNFINQSIKRGYKKEIATGVYNLIFRFASYGFNRSHSVAYSMIAYKMAYLKANYIEVFMKNLLSSAINSDNKTKEYIYECKKNKIEIAMPDINISKDNYIIYKKQIIYPLTNIKSVGLVATKEIIKNQPYKDIFDFVKKSYHLINNKILTNLILSGCFDSLGYNRKTLINNLDIIINYSEIGELLENTLKPELEITDEFSKNEIMKYELEVFGFYLSNHPISQYKGKYTNIIDIQNYKYYFNKIISTIVKVDRTKEIMTKKNEKMMFISVSDELEKIDAVVFPNTYKSIPNIKEDDILYIVGKIEKRFDKFQLVCNTIKKLNN